MRKILFVAAAFMMMTIGMSCSSSRQAVSIQAPDTYGVSVQSAYTMKPETLSVAGLDSLLKTDRLPRLAKWTKAVFTDDETNVRNVFRTLYDHSTGTVYTLKELNANVLVLTKRRIRTSSK